MKDVDPERLLEVETGGRRHVLYGSTETRQHTPPAKASAGFRREWGAGEEGGVNFGSTYLSFLVAGWKMFVEKKSQGNLHTTHDIVNGHHHPFPFAPFSFISFHSPLYPLKPTIGHSLCNQVSSI